MPLLVRSGLTGLQDIDRAALSLGARYVVVELAADEPDLEVVRAFRVGKRDREPVAAARLVALHGKVHSAKPITETERLALASLPVTRQHAEEP